MTTHHHQHPAAWLAPTLRAWTAAALAITLAAGTILLIAPPPSTQTQALIMAALVAALGLPHGAFDLHLARQLLHPAAPRTWLIRFAAAYLALAALAAALWIAAPAVGLATLLTLGTLHWGLEDLEHKPASTPTTAYLALARGSIPVVGPPLFFPDRTTHIFNLLLTNNHSIHPDTTALSATIAAAIATPGLAILILKPALNPSQPLRRRLAPATEIATLTALTATAPPLLAFTIYFCLFHAVRHSLRSAADLDSTSRTDALRRYARAVAAPTLATIALAAALFPLAAPHAQSPAATEPLTTPAIARLVFVGLIGLTIPHVALEYLLHRRNKSNSTNSTHQRPA